MDVLVIGIAGGTGSGKTTLMKSLMGQFGDEITVLSHDNYYRAHYDLPYEARCKLNYDEPAAFETELMVRHLEELRAGRPVQCPVYDFTIHNRSDQVVLLEPKRVIMVEGILIFENKALRDQMDIKIFVDTDADIRLCRRIKRDVNKRGRSMESVLLPVSGHGKAHARPVRGTQQKVCRFGGTGGRKEPGGFGYDYEPDSATY